MNPSDVSQVRCAYIGCDLTPGNCPRCTPVVPIVPSNTETEIDMGESVWIIEATSGPVRGVKSVWESEEAAKASIPGTWTRGQGDAGKEWFMTVSGTAYNSPYRLFAMPVKY